MYFFFFFFWTGDRLMGCPCADTVSCYNSVGRIIVGSTDLVARMGEC